MRDGRRPSAQGGCSVGEGVGRDRGWLKRETRGGGWRTWRSPHNKWGGDWTWGGAAGQSPERHGRQPVRLSPAYLCGCCPPPPLCPTTGILVLPTRGGAGCWTINKNKLINRIFFFRKHKGLQTGGVKNIKTFLSALCTDFFFELATNFRQESAANGHFWPIFGTNIFGACDRPKIWRNS